MRLFPTLKGYKLEYLPKDIFSGIIIAAVSIPIAMGYAQIAGLPAVYGLYGSVLPILFFALFSTSRQFVFGVDATPAAIVGGAIAAHGFSSESEQAMLYIPMVALFAGLWLILFFFLRADKIVDFISTPVMGGFISGIAVTIILMQVPKLMGSPAGRGEILELAKHIWNSLPYINWLSLAMGAGIGSASMMAASTASIVATHPEWAETVQAYAAAANLLTSVLGIYFALFVSLPVTIKVYDWLDRFRSKKKAA